MSKKQILVGKKFGELTVITEVENRLSNRVTWSCLCSCGEFKNVTSKHLIAGLIKTCNAPIHRQGSNSKSWKGTRNVCGKYFTQVQRGAKNRDLLFDITIEDMENQCLLQELKCALTGVLLDFNTNNGGTASLDRIDSSKGYIKTNIQWLHKDVNRMKQEFDQKYFKMLCKLVTNHENITKTL